MSPLHPGEVQLLGPEEGLEGKDTALAAGEPGFSPTACVALGKWVMPLGFLLSLRK